MLLCNKIQRLRSFKQIARHLITGLGAGAMLLLAGCASPPAFDQSDANEFISSIMLKAPATREDQLFNQRFETMILKQGVEKKYRLDYRLTGTSSSTLSVRGSSSTLINSTMSINFSLINLENDETVYQSSVVARASSGTISAYYGQQKSQQFVNERLAGNLAEKVINKLILYPSQTAK